MSDSAGGALSGAELVVGTVGMLARFPIKSTAGEVLSTVSVDERGVVGDRSWAVYTADGGIASGKTTRRFRKVDGLLQWRSTLPDGAADLTEPTQLVDARGAARARHAGGSHIDAPTAAVASMPSLHAPDGQIFRADDPAAAVALSHALGEALALRRESSVRHHDESGVHLVTTSSLHTVETLVGGAVDVRRLRANLVLDTDDVGYVEDGWTGAELAIGPEVVLLVGPGMPRCVMVDQPQADVSAGTKVLKALGRDHDTLLGVQATVLRTGTVSVGDVARLRVR